MPVMKLWSAFWAYWKWFCTALVTSLVILLLIATIIEQFKKHTVKDDNPAAACIEKGGTWDDSAQSCNSAA